MSWVYLVLAGLTEIGWPLGLKLSQSGQYKWGGIAMAITFMGVSGFLLYLAQRDIPTGYSLCCMDRHWRCRYVSGGRFCLWRPYITAALYRRIFDHIRSGAAESRMRNVR